MLHSYTGSIPGQTEKLGWIIQEDRPAEEELILKFGQVDFADGKITQNLIASAVPLLAAQILNLLYSIVDRIYIGQLPGSGVAALGGIGICFPVISIILGFANLYGAGGAPLCSIALGERNDTKAASIMHMSFYLLIITAIILEAVGLIWTRGILVLFGAEGQTLEYGIQYLRIYMLGNVFSMISLGMNPFLNAQGFTGISMLSVLIGTICNLVLDPILIFGGGMGVRGAAIATVISQFLSAAFVIWFLCTDRARLHLCLPRQVRWSLSSVRDIVSLGFAGFIMQVTNSFVQIACNFMLFRYGEMYVSVMTIINSIRQILDTPVLALSDGASPVISYNYGAGNYAGVRKTIRLMTWIGLGYTALVWALLMGIPGLFIGIFNHEPEFLQLSVPFCRIYFCAFIFQALQYAGQSAFKSLNRKKEAVFFSLLRKVIIVIPLTLWLPQTGLRASGVFWAEPVSNVVGGTACFITMLCTVYFGFLRRDNDMANIQ